MAPFGGFPGRGLPGQGTRLRRKVTGTAIAAATMAALTASQAPGADMNLRTADPGSGRPDDARPDSPTGDGAYHTELPPLESPAPPRKPSFGPSQSGIPASLLAAYKAAARSLGTSDPACGLDWELLAAIGKVESGQARGGAVDREGTTLKPIRGPVLDGRGYARIHDTDEGRLDGDTRYDRAVGPMQFIPSTWHRWSADGNGDGRRDPSNIHDAALAAAGYLCAGERDLATKTGLHRAVLSYNDSAAYLRTVLAWYEFYRSGTHEIPDGTGPLPDSPGAGGSRPGDGGDGGGKNDGDGGGSPDHGDDDGDSGKPAPAPGTPASLRTELAGPLTAYTGGVFEDPARVRVLDTRGKSLQGVRVTYEIKGSTGARFPGGARKAVVTTGTDGRAATPQIDAGRKAGTFTLTASAGRGLTKTLGASVAPRYTFAPDPEGPLEAPVDDEFPDLAVKLAHEKKPAGGVQVTATLLTADGEEATEGPYFKGLLGEPVREHTGYTGGLLGEEGVLDLPALHTGDRPGTYTLRLSTADGSTTDLELTVTKR